MDKVFLLAQHLEDAFQAKNSRSRAGIRASRILSPSVSVNYVTFNIHAVSNKLEVSTMTLTVKKLEIYCV